MATLPKPPHIAAEELSGGVERGERPTASHVASVAGPLWNSLAAHPGNAHHHSAAVLRSILHCASAARVHRPARRCCINTALLSGGIVLARSGGESIPHFSGEANRACKAAKRSILALLLSAARYHVLARAMRQNQCP
jgi:hypothetical protein